MERSAVSKETSDPSLVKATITCPDERTAALINGICRNLEGFAVHNEKEALRLVYQLTEVMLTRIQQGEIAKEEPRSDYLP